MTETAGNRLVIVLWAAGPERPDLAAAPFVYALAARALEIDVEMHYTGAAVKWLSPGIAEQAFTDRARTKTVLDFLCETRAAGVRHYACSMAAAERLADRRLIDEAHGFAGAASVIAAAAAAGTRTLVF